MVILSGLFLYSCEGPEGPTGDADRLNKIAEQVEILTGKVDELSQKFDELSKQMAAPVRIRLPPSIGWYTPTFMKD